MKRLSLIATFLFSFLLVVHAQQKNSIITLKNGTQLIGKLTEINPTKGITILISGVSTTISMEDISKIEEQKDTKEILLPISDREQAEEQDIFYHPEFIDIEDKTKLIILDKAEYPDSISIDVDGITIKMVLVRGGKLCMGYDGRHSLAYGTEPMHNVLVTSFYISETPMNKELYALLSGKKGPSKGKEKPAEILYKRNDYSPEFEVLRNKTRLQLRLPTEAEWEYAAELMGRRVFKKEKCLEVCSDLLAPYTESKRVEVDPQGPISPYKKYKNVVRSYSDDERKYARDWGKVIPADFNVSARIVIKVKDYLNIQQ